MKKDLLTSLFCVILVAVPTSAFLLLAQGSIDSSALPPIFHLLLSFLTKVTSLIILFWTAYFSYRKSDAFWEILEKSSNKLTYIEDLILIYGLPFIIKLFFVSFCLLPGVFVTYFFDEWVGLLVGILGLVFLIIAAKHLQSFKRILIKFSRTKQD